MEKVLYFEGAGMDYEGNEFSDVGNYRIRAAFKNLDGVEYYIELGRSPRYNDKHKVISDWALRIDHLFKIKDRHKEEFYLGGYEIKKDWRAIAQLDYSKKDITNWINENLNCDFNDIQVLNDFYGYRVHGESGKYNLMENIELNHDRAKAREQAYNKIDKEYRDFLNEKYSKITLLDMEDDSITIKCYVSNKSLKGKPREQRILVNY